MPTWTEVETAFLLKNHPDLSYQVIANHLGRTRGSVRRKMETLKNRPQPRGRGGKPGARPGEAHHKAVLTEADVREIRRKYAEGGHSHFSIWQDYIDRVSALSTISSIIMRKTWKHV